MESEMYDANYYLYGVESGRSNYSNYRWLPEMTLSLAMTMIDFLDIKKDQTILDYGCALGYLVKAFRLLHRQAWGVDTSSFAIENLDPAVRKYCFLLDGNIVKECPVTFDLCIAKDVFEHIKKGDLLSVVNHIPARKMFVIVPLGENNKYFAPANNMDITHIICEDLDWWNSVFENAWQIKWKGYRVDGIKEPYYKNYPKAHGFLVLDRK